MIKVPVTHFLTLPLLLCPLTYLMENWYFQRIEMGITKSI